MTELLCAMALQIRIETRFLMYIIMYTFHILSYISSLNGLSQHVHHIIPLTVSSFEALCPAHQDSLKYFVQLMTLFDATINNHLFS